MKFSDILNTVGLTFTSNTDKLLEVCLLSSNCTTKQTGKGWEIRLKIASFKKYECGGM